LRPPAQAEVYNVALARKYFLSATLAQKRLHTPGIKHLCNQLPIIVLASFTALQGLYSLIISSVQVAMADNNLIIPLQQFGESPL